MYQQRSSHRYFPPGRNFRVGYEPRANHPIRLLAARFLGAFDDRVTEVWIAVSSQRFGVEQLVISDHEG